AGPTSYATGAETARQLLASRHRPEGVFCVTDLIACGFIDVARHEFGLRVPEDICIIGFDDIEQSSWIGYQLTTFTQPLTDMADAMIDLLHPATHHASTDHSLADQPQIAHPLTAHPLTDHLLTDHLLTNQRQPQTLTFQAPPVWRKTVRPA
ncbi:substrate-binding domain-containing protein, partial [Vibrio sp. PP-XX7]